MIDTTAASSSPAPHRHIEYPDYRCSLPGLTGFNRFLLRWTEDSSLLTAMKPPPKTPLCGISPAVADCRLQGTAGSPPSTTKIFIKWKIGFSKIFDISAADLKFSISKSKISLIMFCGAEEDRTPDLRIANATLSHLSYGPNY